MNANVRVYSCVASKLAHIFQPWLKDRTLRGIFGRKFSRNELYTLL